MQAILGKTAKCINVNLIAQSVCPQVHSPQLWGTEALQTAGDPVSGSAWWSAISGRQSATAKQTNSGSVCFV